jgi:hypothetical protein
MARLDRVLCCFYAVLTVNGRATPDAPECIGYQKAQHGLRPSGVRSRNLDQTITQLTVRERKTQNAKRKTSSTMLYSAYPQL